MKLSAAAAVDESVSEARVLAGIPDDERADGIDSEVASLGADDEAQINQAPTPAGATRSAGGRVLHMLKDVRRHFEREDLDDDVPIIARAHDAMSDEEAWASMGAMFDDNSPINCVSARSKDLYEIALEQVEGVLQDDDDDVEEMFLDDLICGDGVDEEPVGEFIDKSINFASEAWARAGAGGAPPEETDDDKDVTAALRLLTDDLIDGGVGDFNDDFDEPITAPPSLGAHAALVEADDDAPELFAELAAAGSETTLAVPGDSPEGYPAQPDVWASAYGILYEEASSSQTDRARRAKRPPKLYVCHHFKMGSSEPTPAPEGVHESSADEAAADAARIPAPSRPLDSGQGDRIAAEARDRVLEIMREELHSAHLECVIRAVRGDLLESEQAAAEVAAPPANDVDSSGAQAPSRRVASSDAAVDNGRTGHGDAASDASATWEDVVQHAEG